MSELSRLIHTLSGLTAQVKPLDSHIKPLDSQVERLDFWGRAWRGQLGGSSIFLVPRISASTSASASRRIRAARSFCRAISARLA